MPLVNVISCAISMIFFLDLFQPLPSSLQSTKCLIFICKSNPKEITVSKITFVFSQHLLPPFNPNPLFPQHGKASCGCSCGLAGHYQDNSSENGWLSSQPFHVSTLSGPRIPQQFSSRIHSGIFNVFLLGLERKLKVFLFFFSTAQKQRFCQILSVQGEGM